MKKLLIAGLVLALLAPSVLFAQNDKPAVEDPAHQELRLLRDGFLKTINSGDLDGTLSFLQTNVVVTWHNAEVSRGHAGVRAYFDKVMSGPTKIVDSFNCTVTVDELAILYGGDTAIAYGGTDEQFKLANGRTLNVKGRWSATLVKENGRWLVASLHASTNLFDNVMLDLAKKTAGIAGIVCFIIGIVIGWLITRRMRKPAA